MKDVKVTFPDDCRDFSGWTQEKCDRILLGICCMIRDLPDIIKNDDFQDVLDNALKIYALYHENLNGIRCDMIYSLLIRFNVDGYLFLEDLIHNTKSSSIMSKLFQAKRDEKILTLIEQNDKLNRTAIAEQLEKSDRSNVWICQIANDIENVHNNLQTWDWFYNKHRNDRDTFQPQFDDSFIQEVFEYFNSGDYRSADEVCVSN